MATLAQMIALIKTTEAGQKLASAMPVRPLNNCSNQVLWAYLAAYETWLVQVMDMGKEIEIEQRYEQKRNQDLRDQSLRALDFLGETKPNGLTPSR